MGKDKEIKLESDMFELQRQYKHALSRLEEIKEETVLVIDTRDKAKAELETLQEALKSTTNEISEIKLEWTQFRHEELLELENKKADVDRILKKEAEFDKKIAKIEEKEAELVIIRNEQRALEEKNKEKELEFISREKEFKALQKEIDTKNAEIDQKIASFNESLLKLVENSKLYGKQ